MPFLLSTARRSSTRGMTRHLRSSAFRAAGRGDVSRVGRAGHRGTGLGTARNLCGRSGLSRRVRSGHRPAGACSGGRSGGRARGGPGGRTGSRSDRGPGDGPRGSRGAMPTESGEAFEISDADVADEPIPQVRTAGATTDPVKDYLQQIGRIPLLRHTCPVNNQARAGAPGVPGSITPRAPFVSLPCGRSVVHVWATNWATASGPFPGSPTASLFQPPHTAPGAPDALPPAYWGSSADLHGFSTRRPRSLRQRSPTLVA